MSKILAIDDQKENLLTIKGLLQHLFPTTSVLFAQSGEEGIEIAKKEDPDIILLDVVMTGIDGYETCYRLKQNEKTNCIPIIMLSSLGNESVNRIKGLNSGADAFLARPFVKYELQALINVMFRIRNAENELRADKKNLECLVTERTKDLTEINKKLTESENRFKQIIENSKEWVWELDDTGKYTFVSAVAESILNLPKEEIIGKLYFFDFFHPNDMVTLKQNASKIFSEKKPFYDFISRNVNKQGEDVWLASSGFPLFDEKGNFIGYRGTNRNVTEKKIEENLQKTQLELVNYALDHTFDEFRDKLLIEVELLTGSDFALYHIVDEGNGQILLQNWSAKAKNLQTKTKHDIEKISIADASEWLACIKNRKSLIENDCSKLINFNKFFNSKKSLSRVLSVPVIRGNKIMAVLTVANKQTNFTKNDLLTVQRLADISWEIALRKQTEETLRKSEELNRSITKTAVDAIVSIDSSGIILSWNISAERIFGYSSTEMIGNNLSLIIPNKFRSGHESGIKNITASGQQKHIGKTIELSALKKGGIEIPIELSLSAWEVDNKEFFTGIIRDITFRKRTQQIQKVLYNISNAVITTDNSKRLIGFIQTELGTIIDTKNFYIALYDKEKDLLNLPFIVDEKDTITSFAAGKTLTAYVIRSGKPLLANSDQQKIMEKNGDIEYKGTPSKIWLGVPLKIEDEVIGVLAVQSYSDKFAFNESDMKLLEFVSDQVSISIHRKKSVEDLIIALEKATESDKLKTAFLQNISHEIRTPMNGILGFASLLSTPDISNEEQKAYIDIISISGTRMLNTLNDIMDISMLETGQMKMNISKFNLNDKLINIHSIYNDELAEKGIKFNYYNQQEKVQVDIETDAEKLNAIFSNLIKNAIKYTSTGSIDFGFSNSEGKIEFFVRDTGIGIPVNRLKAIFNRFEQADIGDVKMFEGSGLGLSISKAYVEMLGGEIWVNSEVGKGSEFKFTIPYNSKVNELNNDNLETNTKTESKYKFLIVEDEEIAAEYLSIVLSKYKPSFLYAKTGVEAIEQCVKHNDIDVILMDIKMPVMGGYEATREIRKFNKDVFIIAQSAYALGGDKEKGIAAGCNEYVTKPIDNQILMEIIDEFLNQ